MPDIRQVTDKELRAEVQTRSWMAGECVGDSSFNFYHACHTAARDELYRRHREECVRKHDKEQRERYGDHAIDCALQAVAEGESL